MLRGLIALIAVVFSACAHLQQPSDDTLKVSTTARCEDVTASPSRLRIASYNIKSGTMGSLAQVADVLARLDPDVVALQEVDRNVGRSHNVDEAAWLAEQLGYDYAFAGAIKKDGGSYGIALLSRLPIMDVERIPLHALNSSEPRVALHATLCSGRQPINVIATHADMLPWSALDNIKALASKVRPLVGKGLVVLGDLNSLPDWPGPGVLRGLGLRDLIGEHAEGTTFVGDPIARRIDYIFADAPVVQRFTSAGIFPHTASDHLPIFTDLDVTSGF